MKQLQFKDLIKLFKDLKRNYSTDEILEMPIYMADYYVLHEIHQVSACEKIKKEDEEIIDETYGIKCDGKAILIY